jgi:hypothetical protein
MGSPSREPLVPAARRAPVSWENNYLKLKPQVTIIVTVLTQKRGNHEG